MMLLLLKSVARWFEFSTSELGDESVKRLPMVVDQAGHVSTRYMNNTRLGHFQFSVRALLSSIPLFDWPNSQHIKIWKELYSVIATS